MLQTEQQKNESPFLSGPILPPLVRFALPLMLSLLLQALYGGVDLAVVGQFAATSSVCAVAIGSQVMHAATGVVTGLTMGVTVLLGKAIGAGDRQAAAATVAAQVRLFCAVALGLTGLLMLLAPQASAAMNVPVDAMAETVDYIRICSAGMVLITAYNGISGIFRGIGNSRSPFLFVLIACAVNVGLDLLFVAVWGWASAGAAWATVIAQGVSVAFSLGYIRLHPLPFQITRASFSHRGVAGAILKVGAPIAFQDFLVNISFLIITGIVNTLGLVAAAGVGIAEKLYVFLSIVPMAFMSALSAFVAQNMGGSQPQRARQALQLACCFSFSFGAAMFLLTFFAGAPLASLFDQDPSVIAATALYLKGCSFEYLFISLTFCFLGYFNGIEHTAFVMAQGIISSFLVRIPVSYLASRLPGADVFTIGLAVPISALFNLLLCLWYFWHIRQRPGQAPPAAS